MSVNSSEKIETQNTTDVNDTDHDDINNKNSKNPNNNNKKSKPRRRNQTQNQNKHKNKNPWHKQRKPTSLDDIMNEQKSSKKNVDPFYIYCNDDNALLEQQMILQAIAESNKMSSQTTQTNTITKTANDEEEKKETIETIQSPTKSNLQKPKPQKSEISDEIIAKSINQINKSELNNEITKNDAKLAILLQKEEQRELKRKKHLQTFSGGKYAKVTTEYSAQNIPANALQFCYDDESIMYDAQGMTKQQFMNSQKSANAMDDYDGYDANGEWENRKTKHDSSVWSKKHMQRLNEYETGGDFDTMEDSSMNISNRAFNSFRNQLDKKGFVNYQKYALEPNQLKNKKINHKKQLE